MEWADEFENLVWGRMGELSKMLGDWTEWNSDTPLTVLTTRAPAVIKNDFASKDKNYTKKYDIS